MIDFRLKDIVPRFILRDRNGYAVAKAIETGLKEYLRIAQEALDTWGDPEKMPEWRLDELAWEYGIVYDYSAQISEKRKWIANAYNFYRIMGTPAGVIEHLKAKFDTVKLTEWWEYDGEPYHFKVEVNGDWDANIAAWTAEAINRVKNLRSTLDELSTNGTDSTAAIIVGAQTDGTEITAVSVNT